MDKILDRLYIGDGADGRNAEALRSTGITSVMNAQLETDSLGGAFTYLRLNQPDCEPIPRVLIDSFLTWMRREMSIPGVKVLVHCGAGVSRASAFTIAYLMSFGFSWDEAEVFVRSKRPQISPHPALKNSVIDYFGYGPNSD